MKIKWQKDKIVRLEFQGHRLFLEDRGPFAAPETCRWAIADNSGRTPELTEDGILWLDFKRYLHLALEDSIVLSIPLRAERGGETWAPAGVDSFIKLREMFPAWPVRLSKTTRAAMTALRTASIIEPVQPQVAWPHLNAREVSRG